MNTLIKDINWLLNHLSNAGADWKSSGYDSTAEDYQLCIDVINQLTDIIERVDWVDEGEVNIKAIKEFRNQ